MVTVLHQGGAGDTGINYLGDSSKARSDYQYRCESWRTLADQGSLFGLLMNRLQRSGNPSNNMGAALKSAIKILCMSPVREEREWRET